MYDLSAKSSIVTGLFQRRNESALYPWLHGAVTNLNLFPRRSIFFRFLFVFQVDLEIKTSLIRWIQIFVRRCVIPAAKLVTGLLSGGS